MLPELTTVNFDLSQLQRLVGKNEKKKRSNIIFSHKELLKELCFYIVPGLKNRNCSKPCKIQEWQKEKMIALTNIR